MGYGSDTRHKTRNFALALGSGTLWKHGNWKTQFSVNFTQDPKDRNKVASREKYSAKKRALEELRTPHEGIVRRPRDRTFGNLNKQKVRKSCC
jgi:hypothetical protein